MTSDPEPPMMVELGPVSEVDSRGVKWRMRRETSNILKRGGALDFWARAESREAQSLEASPGRMAFRTEISAPGPGSMDIEVTIFLRPRVRDVARSLMGAARARRIWHAARILEQVRVPTPRVLAAGFRRPAGFLREDVLITEVLDATPGDEYLRLLLADDRARVLRVGAPVLAQALRQAHAAGVRIRDLEVRDILIAEEPGGARQIILGGLEKMSVGTVVSLGSRLDDLASLGASIDGLSRAEQLRFFDAYADGIPVIERHRRAYLRMMGAHVETLRERRRRKLERDCLGTNADFRRLRVGACRGHTIRGAIELGREEIAHIPAAGLPLPKATVLKDAPEGRVYEQTVDLGVGAVTIIVKQKRRIGAAGLMKTFCRRVGAERAWRMLWAMKSRGLPVEEPLAAFERRSLGFTFDSTLITRKVEGAENLLDFVASRASAGLAPALRGDLARAVGALVARMHEAGFVQRDLKAPNVLVRIDGSGRPELTLIDVDGVSRVKDPPTALCARDLGRLAADFARMPGIHATDFARTLDAYLSRRPVAPEEKREFIALIRARAEEILRRHDAKL